MLDLLRLQLSLTTPDAWLTLIPVAVYLVLCIAARVAYSSRRPQPTTFDGSGMTADDVHPALAGSLALDKGYLGSNSLEAGLFDQAAAAMLHAAEYGAVELEEVQADGEAELFGSRASRRSRRFPFRYRYVRTPADPIDLAAKAVLYPWDDGRWIGIGDAANGKRDGAVSLSRALKDFDQALFDEASAQGLVEETGLLVRALSSWAIYALEFFILIGVLVRLGPIIAAACFLVLMVAAAGVLPRRTGTSLAGVQVKESALRLAGRVRARLDESGEADDGDARPHALEVLVAMGCVHRAGNLVEGAAVAIAPDADGDEALGRVLEWCVPRAVGGYLRVAPITLLSDEGERYRRARHDD